MLQAPLELIRTSLPLSSTQKANRTAVAAGGAARDEMTPGAWLPGLLNHPPLDCEPPFQGPSFDGPPECKLSQESFSFVT
jgi:hypothetical protein